MVVSMSWYSCQDSHLALFLRGAARLEPSAAAFLHVAMQPGMMLVD